MVCKNNVGYYTYDLARVIEGDKLQLITVHIAGKDRALQIYLNIFRLTPTLRDLAELKEAKVLQFFLPPNTETNMPIRHKETEKPSISSSVYKLGSFFTKTGLERAADRLGEKVAKDLSRIDRYVALWHQRYRLSTIDWEGNFQTV